MRSYYYEMFLGRHLQILKTETWDKTEQNSLM